MTLRHPVIIAHTCMYYMYAIRHVFILHCINLCMKCGMNTYGNTYDVIIAHTCMQYMYVFRYVFIPHFTHICIQSRMCLFVHPLPKNDMLHFLKECTSFSICCIEQVTARHGNAGVTDVTSNLSPKTIISNAT